MGGMIEEKIGKITIPKQEYPVFEVSSVPPLLDDGRSGNKWRASIAYSYH